MFAQEQLRKGRPRTRSFESMLEDAKSPTRTRNFSPRHPLPTLTHILTLTPHHSTVAATPAEGKEEGSLASFRISPGTVAVLQGRGVTRLFPIQRKTFDHIYDGKDVIGRARTGGGEVRVEVVMSVRVPLVLSIVDVGQGRARLWRSCCLSGSA